MTKSSRGVRGYTVYIYTYTRTPTSRTLTYKLTQEYTELLLEIEKTASTENTRDAKAKIKGPCSSRRRRNEIL
jgi:hypothetical protein